MVFEIYNADGYVRSAEINSLEDIQNLPERFKQTNECYWEPPHEVIVGFEEKTIRIYDYYIE